MRPDLITRPLRLALGAMIVTALAWPTAADAQSIGERMRRRAEEAAKRKVEERAAQRAGEATDKALDTVECAAYDMACAEQAEKDGKQVVTIESGAGAGEKPGEGAWRNFDFVPGDRVIFAEDFSRDNVGDFPRRLEFSSGNIEVVEWEGARYLSTNTFGSEFSIPLPEMLPEQFTLEFDYSAAGGNGMAIYFVDADSTAGRSYVNMGTWNGGVDGGGVRADGKPAGDEYKYQDIVFPVRIMADGRYVKVYMGDTRVANVPNASLGRSRIIRFVVPGREDRAAMIGNIRVAAGGRELYDALAEAGRAATQGIYFDTGSDRIRPESTPTLEEIGTMLAEHPELKLTIEGHTDNVGDAQANLALSERRAVAVITYLIAKHGIDADRLTAMGLGASRPAVPNETAEGRQQNRRVELVKM